MASPQRQSRLYAIKEHCQSHITMLKEEINMAIDNPVFVAGHSGYFKEIEDKLAQVAEYQGILEVLEKEF